MTLIYSVGASAKAMMTRAMSSFTATTLKTPLASTTHGRMKPTDKRKRRYFLDSLYRPWNNLVLAYHPDLEKGRLKRENPPGICNAPDSIKTLKETKRSNPDQKNETPFETASQMKDARITERTP